MQGCIQLPATSTHYDHGAQPRSKVFYFFLREENQIVWKTLVAQQRTNAQLNSHMAPTGNRTGVTLVRGERFTHKPIVPMAGFCKTVNYPTIQTWLACSHQNQAKDNSFESLFGRHPTNVSQLFFKIKCTHASTGPNFRALLTTEFCSYHHHSLLTLQALNFPLTTFIL